jgi:4-aminobutyrate aminotransferase/(S)-3-amino-2-methylpropionate transaminase
MVAIELVKDGDRARPDSELTKSILAEGLKDGLVLLSCGVNANVIRFLPPLTASDELITEAMDRLEAVIRRLV